MGAYAALGGVVSLLGWVMDVPRLASWNAGGICIQPNTAAAMIAAGTALLLLLCNRRSPALALGVLVALVGTTSLAQTFTGLSLGTDTLLRFGRTWGDAGTIAPGRIGTPGSVSLVLLGAGLAFASTARPAQRRAAAALAVVACFIGFVSVLGYMLGADPLYALPRLTAVAFQTATMVLALGFGLLAALPDQQPVRTLVERGTAGALARRVLPWVVILPVGLGWLRTLGEAAGFYDGPFGTALRTTAEVVILVAVVWWAVRTVAALDRDVRRQAAQLGAFLDSAAISLHRVGPDGTILWANQAELRTLGYEAHEYIGRNITEFHADGPVIQDILRRLHAGERVADCEARMRCKDGSLKTVLIDSCVLFEDGRFVHTQCFTRDVTAQRAAEAAVWESEKRFRQMFDAIPAAIYTTDAEGRITYFNPAAAELAGREPELGSDSWCVTWKLFNADGTPLPHDQCPMAIALKEGRIVRGVEAIAERPDGQRVWFEPFPTPLRDAAGRIVGGLNMLLDITERKRHELAVARLAAIVESSDDAVIGESLEGTIETWNGGAERMFGYTAAEAVGQNIALIVPPDRRAEAAAVLARLRRGEKIEHFETERVAKDGRVLPVSLAVSPIRAPSGAIVGASKVSRDISERRRIEAELTGHRERLEELLEERTMELERSHQRLRVSERLAAMGTLSAGLGHDMGNLLMPIQLRIASLQGEPLSDRARADIEAIGTAVDYLRRLSGGLRLLAVDPARPAAGASTEIRSWWEEAAGVCRAVLPRGVSLVFEGAESECCARVPAAALTQAVFNLVQNAGEALRDRGTGRIVVRAGPDRGGVCVSVADDGPGMSEEVRARCMEPYFSTKTRAISTGLGLSLVHSLVKDAGGRVEIESWPGAGTTISLWFTAAEARAAAGEPGAGRRRAVVQLADARLSALIRAELDTLRYDVLPGPGPADVELLVLDDPAWLAQLPPGGRVVLVAGPSETGGELEPHLRRLGPRPGVREIRAALRELSDAPLQVGARVETGT